MLFRGHDVAAHGYRHGDSQLWEQEWYKKTVEYFTGYFGYSSPMLVYPNGGWGCEYTTKYFLYGRTIFAGKLNKTPTYMGNAGLFGVGGKGNASNWGVN